ncbi:podocan 1 [Sigmodon hispidus]
MLRWTTAYMEDPAFPHLGDSSQSLLRACPRQCSCPRDDTVDCSGLGLRVFPDNITKAARLRRRAWRQQRHWCEPLHSTPQNNQLRELPYNELSRLSGLRTLDLHNNLISSEGLPDEAFESLTQLEHFYVAHNKLSVAPQFLPRSLRVADLAANEVVEIFPLTFGEKPELRSVYLHDNRLSNTGLPPNTFHGSEAITTLSLSSNRLSYLPPSLPASLERLHLQNNLISRVPRGALSLQTQLRELHLQHNQLTDSGLDATTFRLERVPPALPRHLKALVMPHNRVAVLGARDLGSARTLVELNLAYNCLASERVHPVAFRRLRALHSLDLAGNQLSRLPQGLPTSLRSLRLQRNQLRALEPEPLAGLNKLQELSLAHNRLRVGNIGPGTWHELQALQVLDLSHNELSFVPPDLPEALEELHLQANCISFVGPEAFLTTPHLRALFLRANRLHMTSISAEAFLGLSHLRVVDTAENPEQVLVQLPSKGRGP